MARIGHGKRGRTGWHGAARKHGQALGRSQRLGVEAELFGQGPVEKHKLRRRRKLSLPGHIEPLTLARVRIVETDVQHAEKVIQHPAVDEGLDRALERVRALAPAQAPRAQLRKARP